MNAEADKMKQEVNALLQGGQDGSEAKDNNGNEENKPGERAGEGAESGKSLQGGDGSSNGDSGAGGNNLSERDQFELDKAIRSGWKPPDKFKGNQDDFIKPRQWNLNVAWQKRLDREGNERRRLEKEVASFGERVKNVMEVAKANAIAELNAKKKEAIDNADHTEVNRIDNEIKQTEKDFAVETPQPSQELRPEVQDWMEDNPWFDQDRAMSEEAVKIQQGQLSTLRDPNNPSSEELREALSITTDIMKNKYPEKFKRQPRHVAPGLESGNHQPRGKSFGYNDLTDQEKTVWANMDRFKNKQGKPAMSKEEYIQACADMREAK